MVVCPKCGGEMREGEAFVSISIPSGATAPFGIGSMPGMGMPGMGAPSIETTAERVMWREKTERKTGLFKKSEEITLRISGQRCANCGYIELYATK